MSQATSALSSVARLGMSTLRGLRFQSLVTQAIGQTANTARLAAQVGTRLVGTRPDIITQAFLLEIKDVAVLSLSSQIRAQLIVAAEQLGLRYAIIVGPGFVRMSGPLQTALQRAGAEVWQYIPAADTWTRLL